MCVKAAWRQGPAYSRLSSQRQPLRDSLVPFHVQRDSEPGLGECCSSRGARILEYTLSLVRDDECPLTQEGPASRVKNVEIC